jgi:hypothetical protein
MADSAEHPESSNFHAQRYRGLPRLPMLEKPSDLVEEKA